MQREIKFRGQDIDTIGWVYGYPYKDLHTGKSYIIIGTQKTIKHGNYPHLIEVIPETVGQFIGIKDDEGRGIYEHDYVDSDAHGKSEVVWKMNGWFCKPLVLISGEENKNYWWETYEECQTRLYKGGNKIIGNKFEKE